MNKKNWVPKLPGKNPFKNKTVQERPFSSPMIVANNTRGTYCLAEDDVPSQSQHQTLRQAVGQFLKEHEGQGLLGSVHHFPHAVLQGKDEGVQLFIPVLWEGIKGCKHSGISDGRFCKIEPIGCFPQSSYTYY